MKFFGDNDINIMEQVVFSKRSCIIVYFYDPDSGNNITIKLVLDVVKLTSVIENENYNVSQLTNIFCLFN